MDESKKYSVLLRTYRRESPSWLMSFRTFREMLYAEKTTWAVFDDDKDKSLVAGSVPPHARLLLEQMARPDMMYRFQTWKK